VAYISVGSNIDPERNVLEALRMLAQRVQVTGVSTFYRTPAVGPDGRDRPDWPEFLNAVIEAHTELTARELKFGVLRPIEEALGRRRTGDPYGPRPIDLDLILLGRQVIDEPGLRLPSSDLRRPFVALPLLELCPDMVLPGSGEVLSCSWPSGPVAGMRPDAETTEAVRRLIARRERK
jgi:2-amino-4-hydroxy-6-hydroxymethyldihydropteridine diphosphokinase